MVSPVTHQPVRNVDKGTAPPRVDEKRPPAFTRDAVDAKAPGTFGDQGGVRSPAAGFVRQAPVEAENKDGIPGLLGDIANETWNSGVEFAGSSGRWMANQALARQQTQGGASLALYATGGALTGVLAATAFGVPNAMAAGAMAGTTLWLLGAEMPNTPDAPPPRARG